MTNAEIDALERQVDSLVHKINVELGKRKQSFTLERRACQLGICG